MIKLEAEKQKQDTVENVMTQLAAFVEQAPEHGLMLIVIELSLTKTSPHRQLAIVAGFDSAAAILANFVKSNSDAQKEGDKNKNDTNN